VAYSDERTFFPAPSRNASVVGRQIGLLHCGRDMRDFHSRLAQPPLALAGLAAEALAATFVMARAHARPGGQMSGLGEACPVGPDFGEQDLCRAWAHPRDSIQESYRFLLRHEVLINGRTAAVNRLIQIIDLAKGPRSQGSCGGV
jgi:hypothetical protein